MHTIMQRVAGSVVTNDRHHNGARRGMYSAREFYVLPTSVANPN